MAEMIDAHQHFWKLRSDKPWDYTWLDDGEKHAIRRDYLPVDLRPLLEQAGIRRTVFVQAQHHLEETRWALKLAEENDFIAGIVGWVDLRSKDCESQIEEFSSHPKFVGVRHVVQDEPDDNWVVSAETLRGLRVLEKRGVPYDLLFYVRHLRHVPTLARELPNLRMVINHLSKPEIRTGRTDNWIGELDAAAECENVYCKLSGMVTEAAWDDWAIADIRPYVQAALEAFGAERLMFGSDWPVCELAGTYEQVFHAASGALGAISAGERAMIFGGTATEYYGL